MLISGIQVEADAGLRATASFALAMADFEKTDEGRDFRPLNEGQLFLDFLTENPPKTQGTCNVSELNASICPGIKRALADPIWRSVTGLDQHGDECTFQIPFCNYGPLLALKLNAFNNRIGPKKAKDAYDILSLVHSCVDGAEAAVESFGREKTSDNSAMETALKTLKEHFLTADSLGPSSALSFYFGDSIKNEISLRLREDLVTIAHALLES